MLHKTRGIVLHNVKYSETSIICKVFTRQLGLQSYMVNGVRSSKPSAKAPLFRPGNILEMVVYHKKQSSGLQRMKEYGNGFIYRSLPFDIIKSSIALFMLEILNKVISGDEPQEDLYDFIESEFAQLDSQTETDSNYHLYFLLRLSRYLGFTPAGEYSAEYPLFDLQEGCFILDQIPHQHQITPPHSRYISELLEEQGPVHINNRDRIEVLETLLRYFSYHLSGFNNIQSHKILHEVLEG